MIATMEMLSVEDTSYPELIASVPDALLRLWKRAGARPSAVQSTSLRTCFLLQQLSETTETPVHLHNKLPALDAALLSMKEGLLR